MTNEVRDATILICTVWAITNCGGSVNAPLSTSVDNEPHTAKMSSIAVPVQKENASVLSEESNEDVALSAKPNIVGTTDSEKKEPAQLPPNILLIMADDFNSWIGSGKDYPQVQTPRLDELASEGVLFQNALSPAPACNPSRNAMWSGLRPFTTGITSNSHGYIRDEPGFENVVTMNQYFKQNGYFVYGAGKLYHSVRMGPHQTDPDNWSSFDTLPAGCQGKLKKKFKSTNWPNFRYGKLQRSGQGKGCADTRLAKRTAKLLKDYADSPKANKPFFVAIGLFRPHLPWYTPAFYWRKYKGEKLNPPNGYKEGDLEDTHATPNPLHKELLRKHLWPQAIKAYLASLAFADENVGILLDGLEDSGLKNNTIVLFMGDHGWHLGEKDWWGKKSPYEPANRTALIIRDPRAKGNGNISEHPVNLQDLFPTLISLTGLPAHTVEGNDLSPLLNKPRDNEWDEPQLLSFEQTHYLRTKQWKFIERGAQSELYNMQTDPHEWNNLYGTPETENVTADLRSIMDAEKETSVSVRRKITGSETMKTKRRKAQPKSMQFYSPLERRQKK